MKTGLANIASSRTFTIHGSNYCAAIASHTQRYGYRQRANDRYPTQIEVYSPPQMEHVIGEVFASVDWPVDRRSGSQPYELHTIDPDSLIHRVDVKLYGQSTGPNRA